MAPQLAKLTASGTVGGAFRHRIRFRSRKGFPAQQSSLYIMLKFGRPYQDLGNTYLDRLSRSRTKHNLVRRFEGLGYKVHLTPLAA
jgi:hypothetical protein